MMPVVVCDIRRLSLTKMDQFRAGRVSAVFVLSHILRLYLAVVCLQRPADGHNCDEPSIYGKKTADCTARDLKVIPTDLDRSINVLKFIDNKLTYLGKEDFRRYTALQEIDLRRNVIDHIAPDTFRGLHNLQSIDLGENKLKRIPSTVFHNLSSIRFLKIKDNPIEMLTKDAFLNLKNVEELNFENCWLTRIHSQTFKGLNNLVEINIVNNELANLDPEMQQYLPASLRTFRLYRNRWICDCNLRWLRSYVEVRGLNWDFVHDVPRCDGPDLLDGISWKSLDADKFSCPAQIIASSNSSTSIELEVHGNVSIECIVRGDPQPGILWKKGDRFVPPHLIRQVECTSESGQKQTCSTVTLNDLSLADEGDYQCIAQNKAGRAETTYKLWVHDPATEASTTLYGLTSETLIGIGIGAVVLVLLVAACIVWMVRQQQDRTSKRTYKTTNSPKQPRVNGNGQQENHSPGKKETTLTQDQTATRVTAGKEKTTKVTIIPEPVIINQKPPEPITADSNKITTSQENHVTAKPEKKDFKMKIFQPEQHDDSDQVDGTVAGTDGSESTEKTPLCNNKVISTKKPESPVVDVVVPDVVQRPDDSRLANHRPAPQPPTPVGNHVTTVPPHKRAEENPYAKPSDMKPATTSKCHSSKDSKKKDTNGIKLKEGDPKNKDLVNGDTKRPKSEADQSLAKTLNKQPDRKKVTTFAIDTMTSPCKNPICLKDQPSGVARSQSPPKTSKPDSTGHSDQHPVKQHIKSSQSMGGLHSSSPPHRNSLSPTSSHKDHSPTKDAHYKTLPHKTKQYSALDDSRVPATYSRVRKTPQDDYSLPSSRHSLGHHSAGPGVHVELPRPVKTATISNPRQLPPILRNPQHEPQIAGFMPSLPPDPTPTHVRSKTLSHPRTGGPRPGNTSSPGRKPLKNFESTSLDDLLSPPFAHIQVERPKSPKSQTRKLPKPGEKDEYGTAV